MLSWISLNANLRVNQLQTRVLVSEHVQILEYVFCINVYPNDLPILIKVLNTFYYNFNSDTIIFCKQLETITANQPTNNKQTAHRPVDISSGVPV